MRKKPKIVRNKMIIPKRDEHPMLFQFNEAITLSEKAIIQIEMFLPKLIDKFWESIKTKKEEDNE